MSACMYIFTYTYISTIYVCLYVFIKGTTPLHSLPIHQATGSSTFRRIISSSGAAKTSSRSPKAHSTGSVLAPTMEPLAISGIPSGNLT